MSCFARDSLRAAACAALVVARPATAITSMFCIGSSIEHRVCKFTDLLYDRKTNKAIMEGVSRHEMESHAPKESEPWLRMER